jgi:hypothetical protein
MGIATCLLSQLMSALHAARAVPYITQASGIRAADNERRVAAGESRR